MTDAATFWNVQLPSVTSQISNQLAEEGYSPTDTSIHRNSGNSQEVRTLTEVLAHDADLHDTLVVYWMAGCADPSRDVGAWIPSLIRMLLNGVVTVSLDLAPNVPQQSVTGGASHGSGGAAMGTLSLLSGSRLAVPLEYLIISKLGRTEAALATAIGASASPPLSKLGTTAHSDTFADYSVYGSEYHVRLSAYRGNARLQRIIRRDYIVLAVIDRYVGMLSRVGVNIEMAVSLCDEWIREITAFVTKKVDAQQGIVPAVVAVLKSVISVFHSERNRSTTETPPVMFLQAIHTHIRTIRTTVRKEMLYSAPKGIPAAASPPPGPMAPPPVRNKNHRGDGQDGEEEVEDEEIPDSMELSGSSSDEGDDAMDID